MSAFLYDTNCLLALYLEPHASHAATLADWQRRTQARQEMVCAMPCVVECYAVMTRMPEPLRFSPSEAWALLEANLKGRRLVGLTAEETWRELRGAAAEGLGGGLVYDALIAACARKAGAGALVTWNLRHFARLAHGLEVVNPLGERAAAG